MATMMVCRARANGVVPIATHGLSAQRACFALKSTFMCLVPAPYRNARVLFTLLCGMAIVLVMPAYATQYGPREVAASTHLSTDAPGSLDVAAVQAQIAVVGARDDIPVQERDLALKRLREAAARLEAAEAAPDASDVDPVQMQLQLASLQAEAVSLRSKQRNLGEALRNMANRPEQAHAELTDLHRQLEQLQAALPANASPLLIEVGNLLDEATHQELSARIDKIEQELLSLPMRESIATAQRDLTRRRIAQVDAAIAALNTRIDAQRKHEAENQAAQADEFARRLAGQPTALQDYASQTAGIRAALKHLTERVDHTRSVQQSLQAQHDEVAEARGNAEQILAIDRIGDESGRMLRSLQGSLPASNVLESRIANRRDAIVDARVKQLQIRQELRGLQPEDAAARRYLTDNAVADTGPNLALMTILVESRRVALADLDRAQGQLISVLSEANALDSELMQDAGQLRSLLDERLLWLPSAEPLGMHWLQQLGTGVAWLVAPSHWSGVPQALVSTLRSRWPQTLGLLAAIIALFAARRRLVASLEGLARHVGSRRDNFSFTLQACVATLLLALAWPLATGTAGWMLRASTTSGAFANALGRGLLGVALVWFMLGIFIDMCRAHGVFIAHFGWSAQRTARLARALRLLLLAIVPAALLSAMASASGRPDLADGIGRLAFLAGSLALALFLHRAFRPRRSALPVRLRPSGWAARTRGVWSRALVAIPLLLAGLAATGYYATARELQGRLFTSGWIILAVGIVFFVAMRGVLVAGRHTACRCIGGVSAYAQLGAELALEFEQQPLGGLLADPRHFDQARGLLLCDRLRQFGHRQPGEDGERGARPDAGDPDQLAKRRALVVGREAEQLLRVLAHDEVGQQRDLRAQRRQVVEARHRHVDFVADTADVDEHPRRRLARDGAGEPADHGRRLSDRKST